MAYFSNLPLGACISLAAANDVVRRTMGIEQPEVFLEGHQRLGPGMVGLIGTTTTRSINDGPDVMVYITQYSTVDPNRNRIQVMTTLSREIPRWSAEVPVQGSVKLELVRDRQTHELEENFEVIWVNGPDPLGTIFYYPKVVFK